MIIDNFIAWAINTHTERYHGLIGRYWWFNHRSPIIPPQLEGCKIALFKTRKLARENLSSIKEVYPKAQVQKVKMLVEVDGA